MRLLLGLLTFLIVYGSLFPFNFTLSAYNSNVLEDLLHFGLAKTGRGDLLANIVLFMPFGILAMNVFPGRSTLARLAIVLPLSFILAFAVQALQLVIPGRVPSGGDAVLNLIGCAIGCAIALTPINKNLSGDREKLIHPPIPVLLALLWIVYSFAPFAPSIDLQLIKEQVKTLIGRTPEITWIIQSLTMWLVVFHFLLKSNSRFLTEKYYPALILVVILSGFFIVGNNTSSEKLLAALIALPVWIIFRKSYRPAWLAFALVITIFAINFIPFELRAAPIDFVWVPLKGSLSGNLFINTFAIMKKVALYGSLIWLLFESKMSLRAATLATAAYLLASESLQVFFINTTPEITDPLLALAIGFVFHKYQIHRLQPTRTFQNPRHSNHIEENETQSPTHTSVVRKAIHIPGMDGLRAIAAISVFFVHFNQQVHLQGSVGPFDLERLLANGNTGVALFFLLSGMLLSIPFWQVQLGHAPKTDLRGYAWRRASRIIPAYYFCLFAILAAKSVTGSGTSWNNILSHLIFVYNISDHNILALNQPFWTLAAEVQFYLILPLIFLILRRTSATTATWMVFLLIPALYLANHAIVTLIREHAEFPIRQTLIWPFSVYISNPKSFVLTYFTLGHLPHFLLGVLAARIFLKLSLLDAQNKRSSIVFDALFWGGVFVTFIILSTPADDVFQIPNGRYNFPVVPALLAAILVSVPFSKSAKAVLTWKTAAWLGTISYGIYIYHYPIQKLTSKGMKWIDFPAAEHAIVFGAISFVTTLLCSQISYVFLEAPAVRWTRRYLRNRHPEKAVAHDNQIIEKRIVDGNVLSSASPIYAVSKPEAAESTGHATTPTETRDNLVLNIRRYQLELIQEFSRKSDISISALCNAIVLSGNNEDPATNTILSNFSEALSKTKIKTNTEWTSIAVKLEPAALRALEELSKKTKLSYSRILRDLIEDIIRKRQQSADHSTEARPRTGSSPQTWLNKRTATAAGVLTVVAAGAWLITSTTRQTSIDTSPAWAGNNANIIFDHHAHTKYSDGALTPAELTKLGVDNGCDAMAITDHSAKGGAASLEQLADIKALRGEFPELLLITGIELNMPSYAGREHVNVIVTPEHEAEVLRKLGDIAETSIKKTGGYKRKKKVRRNKSDESVLHYLNDLRSRNIDFIATYNHPSRKVRNINQSLDNFLRWNNDSAIITAFEGAPGHQNHKVPGSYTTKLMTEDRWDPVVSRVGGIWDQLLSRGYNVSAAIASSDYHNERLDKAPCSFSRIHVVSNERSYTGLIEAMNAGTFWADHGRILDQFQFSIELKGLKRAVYPGAVVRLGASGGIAVASFSIERGPGGRDLPLTSEVISNCSTGKSEIIHSSVIPLGANVDTGLLPIQAVGADAKSCFIRARVRLRIPGESDLMAYTNSIRVLM